MRASQNLLLYSIFFLLFSTLATAWPWPRWLPELDSLIVRAGTSTSATATTTTDSSSSSSSETGSAQTTTGSNSDSAAASTTTGTGKATGTGGTSTIKITGSTGSGSTTSKASSHTSYDARLPAGGVSLLTPSVAAGNQYYKIGDYITFAWNYTSLSATPTAVNVMATCTANKVLYTIAMNQTVGANNTQAVTWDTSDYQATAVSEPLLTETYTLVIYDAASSISANAAAGYLAVFDTYTFGMYSPQAYTPLGEYKCATCSGALSDMERRALGLMIGMSILTVLSFSWFVGGTGVIW